MFTGNRAANCFGNSFPFDIFSGQLEKNDRTGNSAAYLFFDGKTDDGLTTVRYMLAMWGDFDDPVDWTPVSTNTMNLMIWRLVLQDPYKDAYSNVSCVGDGDFANGVHIDLVRTD